MNLIYFLATCLFIVLSILFLSFFIQLFQIKKKENIKFLPQFHPYKRRSKLKRLFIDFPRALARDYLHHDPDEFRQYGCHFFCGEQGCAKTTSMVEKIRELKQRYPKVKVLCNFDCAFSDGLIENWRDIVFTNNGDQGIIIAIDEIQNWFSCNESKDFPPEVLQEITQERKQHKMLIATSQRFARMAKPLREQVNILYEPFTILGCLTFVRVRKPSVDEDGKLDRNKSKKRGTYFFVHDDELRNSFDTFQKIIRQANAGYTSSPFNKEPVTQNVAIEVSDRRRKL